MNKRKNLKIIIESCTNPFFEAEFSDFVAEILSKKPFKKTEERRNKPNKKDD